MKVGLTLALREQLYPRPSLVQQSYPWKKSFFLFFLVQFEEEEDDLHEEERKLLSAAIRKVKCEDYQLPQIYRQYYDWSMEEEFRAQICPPYKGPLDKDQLQQCLKWGEEDFHQLQANKRMSEFYLFDLMIGQIKTE